MSGTGNSTLQNVVTVVGEVVSALAPIVEAADPAIDAAVAVGAQIVQGAIALEPSAVALYNQITNGMPPTQIQLAQFAAAYQTAYTQLDADLKAKLAASSPG